MGVLDAVWSPLSKFVDGGLHIVAKSLYEVADDEESGSVESCKPYVSALLFRTRRLTKRDAELTIVTVDSYAMVAPLLCDRSFFLLFSQPVYECDETFHLLRCWGNLADGWKFAGKAR